MLLDGPNALIELVDFVAGYEESLAQWIGQGDGGVGDSLTCFGGDVASTNWDLYAKLAEQATQGIEPCGAAGDPARAKPV